MFTTLSTALSALNANSTAVSVVGNDLANLNTTGYKTTQVAFQDLMAESMGGINGFQLGMGTARPQTIRQFNQGGLQTGLGGLNAAIQGQGFFMVRNGKGVPLYTRDGSFTIGTNGYLVDANGLRAQGWTADIHGMLNTNAATGDIPVPSGTLFPPVASTNVALSLNLNSAGIAGTTTGVTSGVFSQPISVYDSLGTAHSLTATFTKNPTVAPTDVSANAAVQIATGDSATFTVTISTGAQAAIPITGADGDTLDSQIARLNTQLSQYGISASKDPTSGILQFTSANAFSVSAIGTTVNTTTPPTQNLVSIGTAETNNNTGLYNASVIAPATPPTGGTSVNITVGGTTVTATITGATQTDVDAINAALKAKGITGVNAVLDDKTAGSIELQGSASFKAEDDIATAGQFAPDTVNPTQTSLVQSNSWNYTVTMPGSDLASGTTTTVASGILKFDSKTGQLLTPTAANGTITLTTGSGTNDTAGALADGAMMNDITWDLYDKSGNPLVTQVDQASAVTNNTADGSAAAQLTQVLMGDAGQLLAQFTNGRSVAIGQLSVANIPNPNSMLTVGNNDFEASSQTAAPIVGIAGTGGRGNIVGGALEQSTVDIAQEFSQLITLQNAYQANSRVITTENQILQQTVGLVQP